MTEHEARTKWCPFVRYVEIDNDGAVATPAYNRDCEEGNPGCRCIASDCMAWRRWTLTPEEGHCGLAGKP